MILSNVSIQDALDRQWLFITPEPAPRRQNDKSSRASPFQTSSVDLRLGDEISYFRRNAKFPFVVDLREAGFADLFGPHSESIKITEQQPFILEPHQFVLAQTRERIRLPILADVPSLAARVEGKSSYARCGLLVHFTAPTIHAGFEGHITLELMNLGPLRISLFPDAAICQLILEQVDGIPFRNESQFQGQTRPGGNVAT